MRNLKIVWEKLRSNLNSNKSIEFIDIGLAILRINNRELLTSSVTSATIFSAVFLSLSRVSSSEIAPELLLLLLLSSPSVERTSLWGEDKSDSEVIIGQFGARLGGTLVTVSFSCLQIGGSGGEHELTWPTGWTTLWGDFCTLFTTGLVRNCFTSTALCSSSSPSSFAVCPYGGPSWWALSPSLYKEKVLNGDSWIGEIAKSKSHFLSQRNQHNEEAYMNEDRVKKEIKLWHQRFKDLNRKEFKMQCSLFLILSVPFHQPLLPNFHQD